MHGAISLIPPVEINQNMGQISISEGKGCKENSHSRGVFKQRKTLQTVNKSVQTHRVHLRFVKELSVQLWIPLVKAFNKLGIKIPKH